MVQRMAWPASASLRRNLTMLNAAPESRPDVGSSRKSRSSGLEASSTPMVSRFLCSGLSPSPTCPMVAPAISCISRRSMIVSQ